MRSYNRVVPQRPTGAAGIAGEEMKKNRAFTEEELAQMGRRTLDCLSEAIGSGDQERARRLANRMYREFSAIHDLYRDWLADMMDYVYRTGGPDELYRALRKSIGASLGPMVKMGKLDFRRRVEIMAAMLRGHLVALEVEEDDQKVCIRMNPCGSGQRLLEAGAYDQPRNLAMLAQPHTMTWGLPHFPVYCTHAPVMEVLMMEKLGWPVFVVHPDSPMARRSCAYCLYKNPQDVPAEVFARVGRRRPGSAQRTTHRAGPEAPRAGHRGRGPGSQAGPRR